MTVNTLYDEAVFYTNKETQEQGKENIDVQSLQGADTEMGASEAIQKP